MPDFDPDSYLKEKSFDPDAYLREKTSPPTHDEQLDAAIGGHIPGLGTIAAGLEHLGHVPGVDILSGGANAVASALQRGDTSHLGEDYREGRDYGHQLREQANEEHPVASTIGKVGNVVTTGALIPGLPVGAGASLATRIGAGATTGGIFGASSAALESAPGQELEAAKNGGMYGTLLGGALSGIISPQALAWLSKKFGRFGNSQAYRAAEPSMRTPEVADLSPSEVRQASGAELLKRKAIPFLGGREKTAESISAAREAAGKEVGSAREGLASQAEKMRSKAYADRWEESPNFEPIGSSSGAKVYTPKTKAGEIEWRNSAEPGTSPGEPSFEPKTEYGDPNFPSPDTSGERVGLVHGAEVARDLGQMSNRLGRLTPEDQALASGPLSTARDDLASRGPMDLNQVSELRGGYQDRGGYNNLSPASERATAKMNRGVAGALNSAEDRMAAGIDIEGAALYRNAKRAYQLLAPADKSAQAMEQTGGAMAERGAGASGVEHLGLNPLDWARQIAKSHRMTTGTAVGAHAASDLASKLADKIPQMGRWAPGLAAAQAQGPDVLAATHFVQQQQDPEYRKKSLEVMGEQR